MGRLFVLVGDDGTRTNAGDDWGIIGRGLRGITRIFCLEVEYNNSYKVWIGCVGMGWDFKSWRLMAIEDSELARYLENFAEGLPVEHRAGLCELVGSFYSVGFANGVNSLFVKRGNEVELREYLSNMVNDYENDDDETVVH